jgi:large subunit ribosomal protein L19
MALIATHNETRFGVGDRVRVVQKIKEGEKTRTYAFDGMVLSIKGRGVNRSFTVRRIGAGQIGIERIFPLSSPTIEKVEVVRHGKEGVRHAKLYYSRGKSKKEIEKIYSRALRRINPSKPQKQLSSKKRRTSKK